jgi:hypothetical protein
MCIARAVEFRRYGAQRKQRRVDGGDARGRDQPRDPAESDGRTDTDVLKLSV